MSSLDETDDLGDDNFLLSLEGVGSEHFVQGREQREKATLQLQSPAELHSLRLAMGGQSGQASKLHGFTFLCFDMLHFPPAFAGCLIAFSHTS
jgi:hypothetical protein